MTRAPAQTSLPPIRCPWPECDWEPIPRPIRTLATNTADLATHLLAAHEGRAPGCDDQGRPSTAPQDLSAAQHAQERLASQSYSEEAACANSADDLLVGAFTNQALGASRPRRALAGRDAGPGRA
uniref:hypothetical protein n=1 Tax=uncultured Thiodictyon sp. TaxID=1846217 RepID=UPI0025EDDAC0